MSNYDGYANADETIAVAAVTDYGAFAWYSEPGANLLCALPSSGSGQRAILATDLVGDAGASPGDYTHSFGGTSADAPMLSGIIALMLEANPNLTWRDVQHVLIRSCRIPQTRTSLWSVNSAGRPHSMDYGFGIPDASVAVSIAQQWGGSGLLSQGSEVMGSRIRAFSGLLEPKHGKKWSIKRDNSLALEWDYVESLSRQSTQFENAQQSQNPMDDEVSFVEFVEGVNPNVMLRIEHVRVYIKADTPSGHGYFGATLCGPSGVCSPLSQSGRGTDRSISWSYSTLRHWDEPIVYVPDLDKRTEDMKAHVAPTEEARFGVWTLKMGNLYAYRSDPIVVHSWSIEFHGTVHRV
jgi:hypothetical protein